MQKSTNGGFLLGEEEWEKGEETGGGRPASGNRISRREKAEVGERETGREGERERRRKLSEHEGQA